MRGGGRVNQFVLKQAPSDAKNIRFPIFTFQQLQIPEHTRKYFQRESSGNIVVGDYSFTKKIGGAATISVVTKGSRNTYTEEIKLPGGVRLRLAFLNDMISIDGHQVMFVLDAEKGMFVIKGHEDTWSKRLFVFKDYSSTFGAILFNAIYLERTRKSSIKEIIDAHYKPAFPEKELMK
jgi:hypothetical protein